MQSKKHKKYQKKAKRFENRVYCGYLFPVRGCVKRYGFWLRAKSYPPHPTTTLATTTTSAPLDNLSQRQLSLSQLS